MTDLPKDQAAIVTNKNDGIDIFLPESTPNDEMPPHFLYLMACAMRYYSDPAFAAEMIMWMEEMTRNVGKKDTMQ